MIRQVRIAWACMMLMGSAGIDAAQPGVDAPASPVQVLRESPPQAPRLLPPTRWVEQGALRIAVSLYPQLVGQAPLPDGAMVALAVRPDGSVASSHIRPGTSQPFATGVAFSAPDTQRWLQGVLPSEAEPHAVASRVQGALVDGARLATDLTLYFTRVPAGFEVDRASARVRSIVAKYHRDLLFTGDDTRHRLTVLLGEDGGLLNRHVDRIARTSASMTPQGTADAWAEEVADRLRIDVAQIGLMGATVVRDGSEYYTVVYAWRRRPDEAGPHVLEALPPRPELDTAAAEALVALHFPVAATDADASAGTPALLLSGEGEVLRKGIVRMKNGGLTAASLDDPLLRKVRIGDLKLFRAGGAAGGGPEVLFVWQSPDQAAAPLPPVQLPNRRSRR